VRDRTGTLSPVRTATLIGTSVSISAGATAIAKGTSVTISGRLLRAGTSTPLAGTPIRIDYRRKGTATWVALTTLTTDATGRVSYSHKPAWTVEYRWRYRGSTAYTGVGSATRAVTVR
jgi:hypothetical protein